MSVEQFVREKEKRSLVHHCRGAGRSLCEAVMGAQGSGKVGGRWSKGTTSWGWSGIRRTQNGEGKEDACCELGREHNTGSEQYGDWKHSE